jgi:hypothetical protein
VEGGAGQPEFVLNVPEDLQAGRYANIVSVWHTPHEFTLDFSVSGQVVAPEPGEAPIIPCDVVARIKIAPSLIFDLLQALNTNMTRYEERFGEIQRPQEPGGQE